MKPFFQMLAIPLFLLASQLSANAQSFQFRAPVNAVGKGGFYRIVLPAQVLGQLNSERTDIRLYDEAEQEVPYLLKREEAVQYTTLFREYEVVSKTSEPKKATRLVLRNAAKSRINNLSLVIKNANVRKKARLSGSTDATTWYVIEEEYTLEAINSTTETAELKILDFPLSDYEYYQLEINDSLSAPLNILRVGYYDVQTENGKYAEVPNLAFAQHDSSRLRQSFVRISFPKPVRFDKLAWDVREPAFYRRQAQLFVAKMDTDRKGRRRVFQEVIQSLELHSAKENMLYVSDVMGKEFTLAIENGDNAPLRIGQLKAYFLNTYLVAELKPGKSYHVAFAKPDLGAPSYDLAYFEDRIPNNPSFVSLGEVSQAVTDSTAKTSFFTSQAIIWLAIGLVIALLGYSSLRMLKEVGNKQA